MACGKRLAGLPLRADHDIVLAHEVGRDLGKAMRYRRWPSGEVQTPRDVAVNRHVTITEPE